jgi:hypothetical protein
MMLLEYRSKSGKEYISRRRLEPTPSIDHLFNRGIIGLGGSGRLLVSPVAHKPSLEKMGVKVGEQINSLKDNGNIWTGIKRTSSSSLG